MNQEPTKTLILDLPYPKDPAPEGKEEQSNIDITKQMIGYGINNTYTKGLQGQLRRIWGRLQRKIDEAVDQGVESIEVTKSELELINKVLDVSVPWNWAKLWAVLEDHVTSLYLTKDPVAETAAPEENK